MIRRPTGPPHSASRMRRSGFEKVCSAHCASGKLRPAHYAKAAILACCSGQNMFASVGISALIRCLETVAAAEHALTIAGRSGRIIRVICRDRVFPSVYTPFFHVPCHIIQTVPIRVLFLYFVRSAIGICGIPCIRIKIIRLIRTCPFMILTAICRPFPFGLRRQSKTFFC